MKLFHHERALSAKIGNAACAGQGGARSARLGFGLVEILISAAIALLALGSVGIATSSNVNAFEAGNLRTGLNSKVNQALDRIVRELSLGDKATLIGVPAAPLFSELTTFDVPDTVSFATGVVTWKTTRVELQYEPSETDDGIDNDGDGLIDEGQVVLTRDFGTANQLATVLATGVAEYAEGEAFDASDENGNGLIDERGFALCFDGTRMLIRLTLERADSSGEIVRTSLSTTVTCRNGNP